MRLEIPLTGTVLVEGSLEDGLEGDPKDPIRPVNIDLGNVSWRMVDVDIENEVMIIEALPAEVISEDTGRLRKTTAQEKAGFLQYARNSVEGHTKDELYSMSKSKRLVKPMET